MVGDHWPLFLSPELDPARLAGAGACCLEPPRGTPLAQAAAAPQQSHVALRRSLSALPRACCVVRCAQSGAAGPSGRVLDLLLCQLVTSESAPGRQAVWRQV